MNRQVLTGLAIAFILGGIEMRMTLARVEAEQQDTRSRVERIERILDTKVAYANP